MKDLTTIMPAYVFMSMLLKVIAAHSGASSDVLKEEKKEKGKNERRKKKIKWDAVYLCVLKLTLTYNEYNSSRMNKDTQVGQVT